jgi:cathepsin D
MYSYYGSIAVGTPPVAYDVVLDTGSADHWLVDSQCTQNCDGFPPYDPSSSSTFANTIIASRLQLRMAVDRPAGTLPRTSFKWPVSRYRINPLVCPQRRLFQLTYCSMTVPSGLCDQISDGLLIQPVSGLLGLAWQALSSAGVKPFWQTLYESNVLDQPLMAFYLTRFQNVTGAKEQESGGFHSRFVKKYPTTGSPSLLYHGSVTGSTNTSLYTGQIDYQDIPSSSISYWTLAIKNLTVDSNSVTLPSGQSSYAAIDTGTTLIGGPASQVASVYAQIPNSAAGTGNYEGYYLYRALLTYLSCHTTSVLTQLWFL